jgi:MoaA/NifB/PqqE/SkfB family radical SAM enzyme
MAQGLGSWQASPLRSRMASYREAQRRYILEHKRVVRWRDGSAFSLVSPPIGSAAARRRVRLIVEHMAIEQMGAAVAASGAPGVRVGRVPHVATIAVTYACQCDCGHCSAAALRGGRPVPGGALGFAELRDVIGQAVDLGATSIVFTGGEPLLHPRLPELVEAVDPAKAVCTVFTNGEYLDAGCVEQLTRAGVFGVYVSLDAATAAGHDGNRKRPGLFDKALAGIGRCRAAGIPVGISTYATPLAIAGGALDALMELARALEVLEVFIFDVAPAGRLHDRGDCLLDDADAARLRDLREAYNARPDFPRVVHQSLFSSAAYPCVAEGCPAAMVQLHVRANGDVTPCDFTPLAFGNVRRQSLAAVWQAMSRDALYAEPSARCRLVRPEFRARLAAAAGSPGLPGEG